MSLFFNMLSRLVITFLPRSKRLSISWLYIWSPQYLLKLCLPLFCPVVTAFVQLLSPVDYHASSLTFLHLLIHTFLKMSFLKHIPSLPSSESTSSWMMIRLQIQRFSSQQIFMSTFMKGFIHSSPNVPCFFLSPSFYICSFLYLYSRTFLIFQPLTQHIFQDTFKYPLGSNSWLL